VALIGLELASNTVKGGAIGADLMTVNPAGGLMISPTISWQHILVFAVTLLVAVFGSVMFRKFFSVIPLLIAMIAGYITALLVGIVDFSAFSGITANPTTWFRMPGFRMAKFDLDSIITMLPVLLVITSEHIGHQIVTGNIVGRDLIKDPGLHRSLLGDDLSTAISGMIGSVPTTTYGENIGVMAVTGVYSVQVIAGAAVVSILMAFIAPLSALISTIPGDVIGGITFLLYGMIGTSGLRILVDNKVDYSKNKNLILTSIVFVAGLSGLTISFGAISITGMTLAAVVAMLLSLAFYVLEKANLMND